jgi:plasmid stabilization system protein ParE
VTPVRFLPAARGELLREVAYYGDTAPGVGKRFAAAVEEAVGRASRYPLGGALCHHGTRSMLVRGFPFSVVYRASAREILVVAIAQHRREPGYWTRRLGTRIA